MQNQQAIAFGKPISDCYTVLMNHATPIIICDSNEDFRSHLREMLSKHGFFHVLEATNSYEALSLMSQEKVFYSILQPALITEDVIDKLIQTKNKYLIIAQSDRDETFNLSIRLGVKNFLSFPFSSQYLVDKMSNG